MYDGIFDDVEHVKEVLVSHGHNSVDKTLVFELLEELKSIDLVVKILLGSRAWPNPNPNSDSSWCSDSSLPLEETVALRPEHSLYLSAALEDSCSSDELEVLEHNVAKEARHQAPLSEPLNFEVRPGSENGWIKGVEFKTGTEPTCTQPVIDLTTENLAMEVDEARPSADLIQPKSEILDIGDSASDSEVEIEDEDYYQRRPYIESEESDGFVESDEKASLPPSPILATSHGLEASNEEAGDNRMEEMLEENNNDPNNNLEDIEVLEQNNARCNAATENSNVVKETERAASPKPGCSKDSYYSDNDFCAKDPEAGERPRVEGEDSLDGKEAEFSERDIGQDVAVIQKIFPSLGRDEVLAVLMENEAAVNRVQLALWELLPDEKPAPVHLAKRKQDKDICPSLIKKFAPEGSSSPEKKSSEDEPKPEAAGASPRSNIIKPAKLMMPEAKTSLVKPPKFTMPCSNPVETIPMRKSSLKLQPSKLEHLKPQYSLNPAPMKTNAVEIVSREDQVHQSIMENLDKFVNLEQLDRIVASSLSDESQEWQKFQARVAESSFANTELQTGWVSLAGKVGENSGESSAHEATENQEKTQSSVYQINKRAEKNPFEETNAKLRIAMKALQNEPEEAEYWRLSRQNTGAVPKKNVPSKAATNSVKIVSVRKAPGQNGPLADYQRPKKVLSRPPNHLGQNSKNHRQPLDLTGLKPVYSASGSRPRSVSPILQKSVLTVDLSNTATNSVRIVAVRKAPWQNGPLANHRRPEKVPSHPPNRPEQNSKNHKQSIDPTGLKLVNSASGSRPRSVSPMLQKSELMTFKDLQELGAVAPTSNSNPGAVQRRELPHWSYMETDPPNEPQIPGAVSIAGPAEVLDTTFLPWTLPEPLLRNYGNAGILQRADKLQVQTHKMLGSMRSDNVEMPRCERKKLEIQRPGVIVPIEHKLKPVVAALKVEVATTRAQGLERAEPLPQRAESLPPKELFNPLINMFPDVDPTYITGLCITAKSRNQSLESLIEILLMYGAAHPRILNPEPEPAELNVDAQYENLQGIFPDAHPEYLRKMAEQYYRDPEAMKNFVQAKLETPDYPTMADYLKKIKITEQIQQYTVDFSAQKFLEIFPDPFKHFENPSRVYRYNVIAMEFLKFHFRMNKILTIQRAYKCADHPNHLSLAAKYLEGLGPDMKNKRAENRPVPTEDIPLLQEFAFIRHKAEIREYMKAQKREEKQEFKRLKENNELLECQCCYDEECMPSKCLTCTEGHIFCTLCIKTGAATKIGEGQTQFPCFVECKGEFALPVLQKVLEPTMFSILLRKRQEEEVKAAGLEGLVSCPFCHFASIPPPEDKVFKCLNPECMKETCRLCKELNHVPLRCDEVIKGEEARHYLEEKMTEALVRKCYSCSRPFFKVEGCNKMTCPCGAMTCYICGEPVKDYRHFNGQGSDRTDLCPLWSDNQMLNAQSVRAVAEAAEKEILKKNPNLKIDAKALMPTLPQASRGPHQDIANAHVLPVHARRV